MTISQLAPSDMITNGLHAIGAPRLLRGLDGQQSIDVHQHAQLHGPLPRPTRAQLIAACQQVGLRGRGGAGFPFADKLTALRDGEPVVVVNGSESEPASWKDRVLMSRSPHLVLDGAVITARAIGAREVVISCHDATAAAWLRSAAAQRRDGVRFRIESPKIPGSFVSGEASAVIAGLDARQARPAPRRVLPTQRGLAGRPTLISNVETFAQVAVLMRMGVHRYAETGMHGSPGTTLLSVGGAVERPLVMEVPNGTPLGIVLATAHAESDLQAVVIGGYHGAWHKPIGAISLSRQGVHDAGGSFGAGVVLAVDHNTCALGELHRITRWLATQSAGQCGPCRLGLPSLAQDLHALLTGDARGLSNALRHARSVSGRGACAHPDGTARFVASGIHTLAAEVEAHLHGGCGRPVLGELPL